MRPSNPVGCVIGRHRSVASGSGRFIRHDRSRSGCRQLPAAPVSGGAGVEVARVSDPPGSPAARRVLVDRLWPRGLGQADGQWDEWCRGIAPSAELHRWYGHRSARFAEFRQRYLAELGDADHAGPMAHLAGLARQGRLILLTATGDLTLGHAHILAERLVGGRG